MASSSGPSAKVLRDLLAKHFTEEKCRAMHDDLIRDHNATFIAQFHLTQSFLDFVEKNIGPPPAAYPGIWRSVPLTDHQGSREAIERVLNDEEKAKCKSDTGLRCVAFEPELHTIYIGIKFEADNYVVNGQWDFVAERSRLRPNAVVSLWGYREEDGEPNFTFRLDGYAGEGEPLPPYKPN